MSISVGENLGSVVVRYRQSVDGDLVESMLDRVQVLDLLMAGPVRDFRWYKGRIHYSGWYWSSTTEGLVAYESRLELARILLADFDADVGAIVAQPFQLEGTVGGVTRRHVPDLLLGHLDGRVTVVDVKPAHRLADPVVREVFAWTERAVVLRGWRFEVWSGVDAVLLANVRFLAGYRRRFTVDDSLCAPVLELVDEPMSVGSLERAARLLAGPELVRPVILHLLWAGLLGTDLAVPLGVSSPIWRVQS